MIVDPVPPNRVLDIGLVGQATLNMSVSDIGRLLDCRPAPSMCSPFSAVVG